MYPSISAGDTVSTSAMLSKPAARPSGGRSALTSTSSASRSRITFAYSARFRRCSAGGSWVELTDRQTIERGLERRGEGLTRGWSRPGRTVGRHHPGPQLADDFLPHIRVPREHERVERVKGKPAALDPRVVATDAVLASRNAASGGDAIDVGLRGTGSA